MALKIDLCRTATALLALAVSMPVAAKFTLERAEVLAISGSSRPMTVQLRAVRPGPGVVFAVPVGELAADSLRLRFVVDTPAPADQPWSVVVLAGGEERWRIDSTAVTEPEFWSGEIAGAAATVQLESGTLDNVVRIRLDRLAFTHAPSVPESIVGDNELASINVFSSEIKALGRAVARIRFVGDDGPIYNCTGFLITSDLLLTNEHCISSESERRSAMVSFDFDEPTSETVFLRMAALLRCNHDLDYSVVRLERALARAPLAIADADVADGAELLVIQHPGGEPKQVSRINCGVSEPSVTGRGAEETDFAHTCDTLGGSSGAPIIDAAHKRVVGLHHLGFEEPGDAQANCAQPPDGAGATTICNQAVHIRKVLADIPDDLLQEAS